MTVKEWIIKEQGRHFCKCGCGTEIIINKIHHSRGIPQYIRGHRMRAEKRGLHGWVEEQQGKHFCQCGCNEVITISRIHHSKGIPKFINGHSWIGKKHSQESKDKQRESKIGKNNVRFGKKYPNAKIDKWIYENQGTHFCKCGCGNVLLISRNHYYNGLPEYTPGHQNIGRKMSIGQKQKISIARTGMKHSQKTKENMSIARKGRKFTEEHKKRISESLSGVKSPMYGKPSPNKGKKYPGTGLSGELNPMYGKQHSKETRKKISNSLKGDKNYWYGKKGNENPAWRGGLSFEPYCHKFNENVKELIREKYNRMCVMCGKSEEKNGKKLSVHHINYNKQQGCDGHEWKLLPLCISCHMKTNNNREAWSEKLMLLI